MYFLWYILIGLVAGYVAGVLVKGSGSGLLVNSVVGIVGGVLGLGTVVCAVLVGPTAQLCFPVSERLCRTALRYFAGEEARA